MTGTEKTPDALTGSAGLVLAAAVAAGAANGVSTQVTAKMLNREQKPKPPKVELPPGARRK